MDRCRIIIPIYRALRKKEHAVVAHNLTVLRNWPATLIGSEDNWLLLESTRDTFESGKNSDISIEFFPDRYFVDTSGYNELMLSRHFYNRFASCKYILICQHDALVLSDSLEEWLKAKFSFIGAPHFEGFHDPIKPHIFRKSQNGGFSLRSVQAMRSVILARPSRLLSFLVENDLLPVLNAALVLIGRSVFEYRPSVNEDVIWSELVPEVAKYYRVPPPDVAAHFAFEACPRHLFEVTSGQLPFGCHAFERYDPDFWRTHLPDELVALINERPLSAELRSNEESGVG